MNSGIWLVEPGQSRAERRVCLVRKGVYVIRYVGISLLLDSGLYYLRLFWTFVVGVIGCWLVDVVYVVTGGRTKRRRAAIWLLQVMAWQRHVPTESSPSTTCPHFEAHVIRYSHMKL
jgi:hypothetical protein